MFRVWNSVGFILCINIFISCIVEVIIMMKLMSCRNGVFMVIKNVLILYVYMELISIIKVIVLFIFVVVLSLFDIFRKG